MRNLRRAGDAAGALRLNEFDVASRSYTGRRWTYWAAAPARSRSRPSRTS
ncbi:hypothetical protein AB0H83_11385 [Dactylosporangium sp. NPDC050688]